MQKGKGTLRPMTQLNLLFANNESPFTRKRKNSCHFDSENSIQESIRRVDPVLCALRAARLIIRRVYSVPCPNALW